MDKKHPDILLIVCDSLGAKHLPFYGYHRNTMPKLSQIVEREGWTIYKNFFSTAQWTLPSHASLFTGLYPSEHGADGMTLKVNRISFTEVLKELGYLTFGISSNMLIHRDFVKGWSDYKEIYTLIPNTLYMTQIDLKFRTDFQVRGMSKWRALFLGVKEYLPKHPKETVGFIINKMIRRWVNPIKNATPTTRKAYNLIKRTRSQREPNKPLFIFVNLMQTHHNYNPPRKTRGKFSTRTEEIQTSASHNFYNGKWGEEDLEYIKDLYDEEILYLDTILSEITRVWDGIIIITSDHGDLHGEHGCYSHMFTTYNDLTHVPLLIRWPRDWNLAGEVSRLGQISDIFATLLEITNAPFPAPSSSISLLSASERKFAVLQSLDINHKLGRLKRYIPSLEPTIHMQPMMSVITQDLWKITQRMDGSIEIHDLNRDFYETSPLKSLDPKKEEALKGLMEYLKKELGYKPMPVKDVRDVEGALTYT